MYSAEIDRIARFPEELEALIAGLSDADLHTPYLAGEWTVAQNVHHLVDSHANAYIRCKLVLTENEPPLKGYDQDAWAALPDGQLHSLVPSLLILRGLHERWSVFFRSLREGDWARAGLHSEYGRMTLADIVKSYAKHCDAHIDQIRRTLAAKPA